ncbi:MAG: toprim domain-containing protein [Prevotella sp.]|nr:toprim domain-containing protein [Prevotella sp.]
MIDRATVDRIIDAANIVDVVSEFVTLRKSGANYKGLCPFHNERTPSFYVSPARNICKCFSCGQGGTPVGFLMAHEQMTYPEALRWLAKKYNIEIQERELSNEEKEAESKRESMFIVNEWAADYFEDLLHNHVDGVAIGMQYFRSRGIRDDIIRKFRLGYDLNDRFALPKEAQRKGYQKEFLVSTGLCYEKTRSEEDVSRKDEGGGRKENSAENTGAKDSSFSTLVDRFAGRVIFPWLSISGKVVAFGGRKLDQATKGVQQKYVNSPDSEIYHKEQNLYGIYQAKKAIAKENCVYMVEGYTDVISMHQCGIENVVANSGTALSNHQIRMLHRFTQNIVLLYDGDEAGIHAALRGTDMLLAEGMNVKVLLFPDGDDPDSFARKHTADDFRRYIEEHQTDFIQFKSDVLLKGVTDPIKRSEAINSIIKSISVITDQITRATYITDCAHRLGIHEATLISTMNKMIRNDKEQKAKAVSTPSPTPTNPQSPTVNSQLSTLNSREYSSVEDLLIRMVIRHGEKIVYRDVETEDGGTIDLNVAQYIQIDLNADGLRFRNPLYNQVLEEAVAHSGDEGFVASEFFSRHHDIKVSALAAEMLIDEVQLTKSLQMKEEEDSFRQEVEHLVLDFRFDYVNTHIQTLRQQIALSASNPERLPQLMEELKNMMELRNLMAKKLGTSIMT